MRTWVGFPSTQIKKQGTVNCDCNPSVGEPETWTYWLESLSTSVNSNFHSCAHRKCGGERGKETDRQQTDRHKDRERIAFFALLFPGLDLSLELYTGKLFLRRRDGTGREISKTENLHVSALICSVWYMNSPCVSKYHVYINRLRCDLDQKEAPLKSEPSVCFRVLSSKKVR